MGDCGLFRVNGDGFRWFRMVSSSFGSFSVLVVTDNPVVIAQAF